MNLTEVAVVEVARAACAERGIPWREPYRAKKGWRNWTVRMPSDVRGGNAIIYVAKRTGTAKIRYYPR